MITGLTTGNKTGELALPPEPSKSSLPFPELVSFVLLVLVNFRVGEESVSVVESVLKGRGE